MNIFETKKIRLKTKSPIHIGSYEQRISQFEFIRDGQYIYPVSEDRLAVFLQEKNLISDYVNAIEKDGNKFDLRLFFKNKKISLNKTEDLETISNKRKIKILGDASNLQEFKPFIKDGFGAVYLPGSSIKGVIRTALLYNALKTLKKDNISAFQKSVEARISEDIDKRINKKRLSQWLNEEWLEDFVLKNKSKSPNTDWLRMLHVTDAYPTGNIETVLIPANILKKESSWQYKKEHKQQNTTIWVECIAENTVFEFEISWDRRLLEDFRRHNSNIKLSDNLEALLKDINSWASDVFAFEQEFSKGHSLENWYKNNFSNFRIGFGCGMVSTTIAILLDESLRKKIRNYAGLDRGSDIAPKSRRVWLRNNTQAIPFGWAKFEVVG